MSARRRRSRYAQLPHRFGDSEAVFVALERGRSVASTDVVARGASPFDTSDPHFYSIYSQDYNTGDLSNNWVFPATRAIEGVFSAASAGALWLISVVFFSYFVVSGAWVALLSIKPIKDEIDNVDLSAAISALNLIVAFITRDQILTRINAVLSPLEKYHALLQRLRTLHENTFSVFRAKLVAFQRSLQSCCGEHGDMRATLPIFEQWLKMMYLTGTGTITNVQLMTLWSLRVFLTYKDVVNDYTDFGITEEELATSRSTPEEQYGYSAEDKPLTILRALLRQQKEQKDAAAQPLVMDGGERPSVTPALRTAESITIDKSIDLLEDALNEVERVSEVQAPPILDRSKTITLMLFLLLIIPLQIFNDVGILSIVFTPIILLIFSFTLVVAWYVGSPFDGNSHWSGGAVYEWRRRNYRMVKHDDGRFKEWIENADRVIERLKLGKPLGKVAIVPWRNHVLAEHREHKFERHDGIHDKYSFS